MPSLLYQFLQTDTYWSWVSKTSMRSGQPGINSVEYASLLVPLPNSETPAGMEEQKRVSGCLSSLDALIAAQLDKINSLKTHKKGLMQQLFPSQEKVKS
jgi:type I restriction enzyme S subunit